MPECLVTVLMPVYNGEEYLMSSVRSILSQTFKGFEFLIVNDCSTDGSLNIIKSFNDNRIVIHNNERNLGQTKSLNIGLKLAKGKYVARMDSDDMAYPKWLEKLLNYIKKYPEYVVVGAFAIMMNNLGKTIKVLKVPTNYEEAIFRIFFANSMNHVGTLLNKKIILANGSYNEEFQIAQDYELWSSLIRNRYRIISVSDILVAVRAHKNSLGFLEEKKMGLSEVAETIYRNVNTLTNLKISQDDAVKLRLFYRFPEQLTFAEFNRVHSLYEKIFRNLKNEFALNSGFLKTKIRKQMLIPYCKKAISEIENKRLKAVCEIILGYYSRYGFSLNIFFDILTLFSDKIMVKKLPHMYRKWQEKTKKVIRHKG